MIDKNRILKGPLKIQRVDIPEWDETVLVRPLTLAEQAKLADFAAKYEKAGFLERMRNTTLRVIQWATVDETGSPVFTSDDLESMLNQPAGGFLRLQDEILKLSGLTEESRRELEKNWLSARSGGPGSGSPSASA